EVQVQNVERPAPVPIEHLRRDVDSTGKKTVGVDHPFVLEGTIQHEREGVGAWLNFCITVAELDGKTSLAKPPRQFRRHDRGSTRGRERSHANAEAVSGHAAPSCARLGRRPDPLSDRPDFSEPTWRVTCDSSVRDRDAFGETVSSSHSRSESNGKSYIVW